MTQNDVMCKQSIEWILDCLLHSWLDRVIIWCYAHECTVFLSQSQTRDQRRYIRDLWHEIITLDCLRNRMYLYRSHSIASARRSHPRHLRQVRTRSWCLGMFEKLRISRWFLSSLWTRSDTPWHSSAIGRTFVSIATTWPWLMLNSILTYISVIVYNNNCHSKTV